MIAKCANPACRARFDHRVGGKFFRFHLPENPALGDAGETHNTHNVIHYWLCPLCSKIFSLVCAEDGRILLNLLEQEFFAEPAHPPAEEQLAAV